MPLKISEIILLLLLIRADHLYTSDYILACSYKFDQEDRSVEAQFSVRDIDFTLCTHYIYNYAQVDTRELTIKASEPSVEEGHSGTYKLFNDGKKRIPNTKTILSLGGIGTVNDMSFRTLYTKDNSFQIFSRRAVGFLRNNGFDGLNIYWQTLDEQSIKITFPKLIQALRTAFDSDYINRTLLLTMTGFVPPLASNRLYDIAVIRKNVDYVFMPMSQLVNRFFATFLDPLFADTVNATYHNANESIYTLARSGMPYNKMVMGVTALGHYVELKDASKHKPLSAIWPTLLRGPKYYLQRRLAYPEVCDMMNASLRYFDNVQKSPYLVSGRLWVGYTDAQSLKWKIEYMKYYGLGGLEFSHVNEDDFSGKACNSGKSPLISFIKSEMYATPSSVANTTLSSTTSTPFTTSTTEEDATTTFQTHTSSAQPPKTTVITSGIEGNTLEQFWYLLYLIPLLLILAAIFLNILFLWPRKKQEMATEEEK